MPDLEITLDDQIDPDSTDPLAQVAAVIADLINATSDATAHTSGATITAVSEGVTVKMTVNSVSADVALVLGDRSGLGDQSFPETTDPD